MSDSGDLLELLPEEPLSDLASGAPPWRVLVADDDPEVHEATRLTLARTRILGRRLELLHASSAAEARRILETEKDIGVLLLDVVMERDDAGLTLVSEIREQLGLAELRIILRTGQPGQVPELETVARYDINDYRTKTELSYERFVTTLTTALRSYTHLQRLRANQNGLRQIITASHEILAAPGLHRFAEGVITQLAAMLETSPDNIVIAGAVDREQVPERPEDYCVMAAAGALRDQIGQPLHALRERHVAEQLRRAFEERCSQLAEPGSGLTLYLPAAGARAFAAYVNIARPLNADERDLLDRFCKSMAHYAHSIERVTDLSRVAYADPRVALPNENGLHREITRRLRSDYAAEGLLALLQIDDYAATHACLGQDYADALLRAVADRLRRSLPAETLLARMRGEVFAVYGEIRELSGELITMSFAEPLMVCGTERPTRVSVGLVRISHARRSADSYLGEAWAALARASQRGGGHRAEFTATESARYLAGTEAMEALKAAIDARDYVLHQEPVLDAATRQTTAQRFGLNWGRSAPDCGPYGTLLLHSGLGARLLPEVMGAACTQAAQSPPTTRLVIPCTVAELIIPGTQQKLQRLLYDAGIEPARIELEIYLESAPSAGQSAALAGFAQLGVRLVASPPIASYNAVLFGLSGFHGHHFDLPGPSDSTARALTRAAVAAVRAQGMQVRLGKIDSAADLDLAAEWCCNETTGVACDVAPSSKNGALKH